VRVLVTGAAGYIGSHAIRQLRSAGHGVIAYDNLSTGNLDSIDGFQFVQGDVGDRETLVPLLRDVDAVMHFAGSSIVSESIANPEKYRQNNLAAGKVLLGSALDSGIRYFVYSSTAAVYGNPKEIPIDEESPLRPVNPYGESKLGIEVALLHANLQFVSFRYFNAAGSNGEVGERHKPETHLIPLTLSAAKGGAEMSIFGNDYPTPDGTCIRDYVHVSDISDAHVRALDYLQGGGKSTAMNLGTGLGNSVREVIREAEEVTGRAIKTVTRPRRSGDPAILVADASRARKLLGWKPERPLRDIVETSWAWMNQ